MISSAKESALRRRMAELGIRESDLEESFIRSGGAGGQHVNKTSTCVQLLHRPSGLIIKCQQDRSQALNRFLARRLLVDKIEARLLGERSREEQRRQKIRRQKRRRSRRSKEKMLADKLHQSRKKENRRSPADWE